MFRSFQNRFDAGRLLSTGLWQLLSRFAVRTPARGVGVGEWLAQVARLGQQLGRGRISQDRWLHQTNELYGRANIPALLGRLDFPRIAAELAAREATARGDLFTTVFVGQPGRTPPAGSKEESRVPIAKISHIQRGRSIPPHGHSSLVSAFLVISGEFHVRQYDKLADRPDALVVRQVSDERQRPGDWSSVTDDHHNVHWLTALTDDCYLFTTKLNRIAPSRKFAGRINIDLAAAVDLGDQRLAAPKISYDEASARY